MKQKREQYEEELKENEHQQHQMELCGQGLEMKLREQGELCGQGLEMKLSEQGELCGQGLETKLRE